MGRLELLHHPSLGVGVFFDVTLGRAQRDGLYHQQHPERTYDPNRLANLNLGFVAWDIGGGYTYFDPKTGHEFSAVAGVTYNLMNPYLQYQNGIDFHLDWAALSCCRFDGHPVKLIPPCARTQRG
jgi:hypothetical protein